MIRLLQRSRPASLTVALTCLLLAASAQVRAGAAEGRAVAPGAQLVEEGRELYLRGCSSCHGVDAEGHVTPDGDVRGPSLLASGGAAAFYYLSSGRMPAADSEGQMVRREPAYGPEEIAALVAYVASVGEGPDVPDVDLEGADLAEGGVLYRANCQACHSAFGSGGALSYGFSAPSLDAATPTEIAAAMRIGPGLMPVFGPEVVSDDQLEDVVAYVEYLETPGNPGGLQIGRNGPVPEGFVIWLFGVGACLLIVTWVGTRSRVGEEHTDGD